MISTPEATNDAAEAPRSRNVSPAMRWLSRCEERRPESPSLRWLEEPMEPPPLEGATAMIAAVDPMPSTEDTAGTLAALAALGHTLAGGGGGGIGPAVAKARAAPGRPLADSKSEEEFYSNSDMDDLLRHFGPGLWQGKALMEPFSEASPQASEAEEVRAGRKVRRTWVQRPKVAAPTASQREGSPLTGHEPSLRLEELSAVQAREAGLRFQADHNSVWRVRMEVSDACRTARLGPGELLCKPLPGSKRIWSYTFDVVLAQTTSSFVNVGLVEWVAPVRDMPSAETLAGLARGGEATLADLLRVVTAEAQCSGLAWQHASERPRQMMLGCRKGVKWYGNNCSVPVFNDDLCEGTLLHFRCDYAFEPDGSASEVRLWMLPSPVVFRRQGWQVAQLPLPLFEMPIPVTGPGERPATRSLWVPAVTLFSQHDAALLAWHGRGRGAGPCQQPEARWAGASPGAAPEARESRREARRHGAAHARSTTHRNVNLRA